MRADAVGTDHFKAAMASFAAGVTIVTSLDLAGVPHALTATAFSSVSAAPPLCLVCLDRRSRTCRALLGRRAFAVNILSANQGALSSHFASKTVDKFDGVAWTQGRLTDCPLIEGALTRMECRVVDVHSGGDHDIVLGRVVSVQVREGTPLVFFRGSYSSLPPAPDALSSNPPALHSETNVERSSRVDPPRDAV